MVEAAATLQGQLIAAESEAEGLKQIYTDNNVRVRSVKARIDELKHQLEKIGGKGESMTAVWSQRGLPLPVDPEASSARCCLRGPLSPDASTGSGFQNLTKEYELAKVQEVKEIPAVKVLDSPTFPIRNPIHRGY